MLSIPLVQCLKEVQTLRKLIFVFLSFPRSYHTPDQAAIIGNFPRPDSRFRQHLSGGGNPHTPSVYFSKGYSPVLRADGRDSGLSTGLTPEPGMKWNGYLWSLKGKATCNRNILLSYIYRYIYQSLMCLKIYACAWIGQFHRLKIKCHSCVVEAIYLYFSPFLVD